MNLLKNVKIDQILGYFAAGQVAKTTEIIDMQGYDGCLFIAGFGTIIEKWNPERSGVAGHRQCRRNYGGGSRNGSAYCHGGERGPYSVCHCRGRIQTAGKIP